MFEKVVICLDGTKRAEMIIPYATEEAAHFNSKLILLRVYNTPSVCVATSMSAADEEQKAVEAEGKKMKSYLENVANPLREKSIDVECVVVQGEAGKEIVDYANENKVGLVAISTELKHGFMHNGFGKTTDFILKQAHVPVMLVKPE